MDPKEARQQLKDAKQRLHANQEREERAGVTHETDEYLRLNRDVAEAEKHVPWWRR